MTLFPFRTSLYCLQNAKNQRFGSTVVTEKWSRKKAPQQWTPCGGQFIFISMRSFFCHRQHFIPYFLFPPFFVTFILCFSLHLSHFMAEHFLSVSVWLFCVLQVLLPASSLLQIHSVREACCKFLLRQLHPSNCLGIRSFAGTYERSTRSFINVQIMLPLTNSMCK